MKHVCYGGMEFMTNYNFKGVTSAMLETDCGPEHMNEECGDTHGNIYES